MDSLDDMVAAIRSCPLVGRGSCASLDECWSDDDIRTELESCNITTKAEAIGWALDVEELRKEVALNQRPGGDDDWQLREWRRWKDARVEYEGGAP